MLLGDSLMPMTDKHFHFCIEKPIKKNSESSAESLANNPINS